MVALGGGRPLAVATTLPFTTMACLLLIVGTATYVGVCQRGELAFCPAFSPGRAGDAAARHTAWAALPRAHTSQILGAAQTFLPPDALARGTSNYGSGQRMERLGRKLLEGRPITVAFLGGSITWGRGGYEGGSFVARFTDWLNTTFPHPGHRVANHGLPAVTSALFAACYDKVPEDADLVVLDFTVNDGHAPPGERDRDGYSFGSGARRGFEQLVRKSLKLPGQPAVALLHFFSWNSTRDRGAGDAREGPSFFWRTIEDDLAAVAQYYDAPSLSLRNAAYHLMREGRPGFQTDVSIHWGTAGLSPQQQEALKEAQFFWDENHPWDRTGHRALAELLMATVSRGVQAAADARLAQQLERRQAAAGRLGDRWTAAAAAGAARIDVEPPLPPLPPPMVPDNYEANATSCHLQEEFEAVIGRARGFKYEARAPQEASFVAQKWGLAAQEPGATATLRVDSELGGLSQKLPAVQVHLLFLRSWSGMGQALVECASGCACNATLLDGHWDRQATLTDLATLQVSPHPRCELRLTVLEESSSGAHAFSVSGVVVSSLAAKMERGKIGQWDIPDKQ